MTQAPGESVQSSVFGRLSGRGFSTLLEITYRMNTELTRWPSETFYHGKLRAAEENAERRLALPQPATDFAEVLDPSHPLVFVELNHNNARRHSDDEAFLTVGLLVALKKAGMPLNQAAVVVPFRRQARRIRAFLAKRTEIQPQDIADCVIDTVERMQGQEREVIIVSMTASAPDYVEKLRGFLLQPQRVNVAVTRARSKVIILASEQIATNAAFDTDAEELVEQWRSLRNTGHVIRM